MRTVPTEVARPDPTPSLPLPAPVDLQDVEFVVLTPDNIPEGDDWVFVAVTPDGYEQLSLNQAELLRYLREARYQLLYYRGEGAD